MTSDRLRQMADAGNIEALRFALKEGPEAAWIFADAIEEVQRLSAYDDEDCGDATCPDCRPARRRRALLVRFAALGEPS